MSIYSLVLFYGHLFIHSFFRDTVWSVLTGHSTDCQSNLVMHEVRELETWLLRLLSAPVPVPGKTMVEVSIIVFNIL